MWRIVRDRRLGGHKFCRQFIIGPYIVDFACRSAKVVIELDGSIHETTVEYDLRRKAFLEGQGYLVLRFGTEISVSEFEELPGIILAACDQRARA